MKPWQRCRSYQLQASCICSCVFAISASKSSGKSTCPHFAIFGGKFMSLMSKTVHLYYSNWGCLLQNCADYVYPGFVTILQDHRSAPLTSRSWSPLISRLKPSFGLLKFVCITWNQEDKVVKKTNSIKTKALPEALADQKNHPKRMW